MDGRGGRRAGAALSISRQQERAAAKRRRARRGALISALSTVVVFGVLIAFVTSAPGWADVKSVFFSWDDLKKSFPDLIRGFWLDIKLFLIVEVCVLVLALLIALARSTRSAALFPLRLVAAVFTDVMRGLPVVLLVYTIGFGVPTLGLKGLPTDPLVLGGIALTLAYSGYVAEVYRSGIESVHPSQMAGSLALGLTRLQALRHVILPQAIRRVVPPLMNDFIALQKDVALVSFLGPIEAFRVAQIEASSNFIFTPIVAAGLLYLCVTIPMTRWVDHLQARARRVRGVAEVSA
ncbi:MAG TPA: amino acid ABC transporter permease [Baekduia sp.]